MNVPLILIIALFTLCNISSYFFMAAKTPPFTIFTGAVHYPTDYLYYLSFITQGKDHWLRSYHLFTGETNTLEFLNWIYVLGGHIGSLIRLSPPVIFLCMITIGSIIYLLAAYKLMSICIPKNASARMMAYLLFLLSNAVPHIYQDHGRWIFSYYYPFNNLGHPFMRLINVPHHIFIQCFIMLALYMGITFWQHKKFLYTTVILAVLGILLAGTQPLQWAFVGGVLGVGGIFAWWKTYGKNSSHTWIPEGLFAFLPSGVLAIAGFIPALYLKHLYTLPPFYNMIQWESQQQTYISFWHFLELYGPVMMLGLLGIPWIVKKISVPVLPLLLYMVITILVFFSPVPERMEILNLRFFSVIPVFAAAYISTTVIWSITKRFKSVPTKPTAWFLAFLLIAITIPVTVQQLYERTINALPQDINAYLPVGAMMTYDVARKTVSPTETVLVDYNYASSFAAFTGKHVFVSTNLSTIDFDRKLKETGAFFYAPGSVDDKIAWLKKNNISYIFTNAWTPLPLPDLTIVDKNDFSILYKVE
jgi:hypothetical protein